MPGGEYYLNANCHKIGGISAGISVSSALYHYEIFDKYKVDYILSLHIPDEFVHTIPILIIVILACYSSIWADIDHTQSQIGKRHPYISGFLNKTFGHRGITHYPILLVFIGFFFYLFLRFYPLQTVFYNVLLYVSIGILVGYSSHIILDTFNYGGIAWLAPLSKVKVRIPVGITIKKKKNGKWKIAWKYLKGGNTFDDFFIVFMCSLIAVYFLYIFVIK